MLKTARQPLGVEIGGRSTGAVKILSFTALVAPAVQPPSFHGFQQTDMSMHFSIQQHLYFSQRKDLPVVLSFGGPYKVVYIVRIDLFRIPAEV